MNVYDVYARDVIAAMLVYRPQKVSRPPTWPPCHCHFESLEPWVLTYHKFSNILVRKQENPCGICHLFITGPQSWNHEATWLVPTGVAKFILLLIVLFL